MFDLGEIDHSEVVEQVIFFRNTGSAVLTLEKPITGCNCARAELSATDFAPGETGSFNFALTPAAPPGSEYNHEIVVPCNDPRDPRRTIRMHGRMRSRLLATPHAVGVYGVHPGLGWNELVVVHCSDAAAQFEITAVECNIPGVAVEGPFPHAQPSAPDSPAWLLLLAHVPTAIGTVNGILTVRTDHPVYSSLDVPITLEVTSRLTATPPSILLSPDQDSAGQIVTLTGERPFRVIAPADEPESLYTVSAEAENDSRWLVHVAVRPGAAPTAVHRGDIHLQLEGVDHEPEFRLPCSVVPGMAAEVARDAPPS